MLTPDFEFTVRRATTYVPDVRASHFWDRSGQLSKDFAPVLKMWPGGRAWDVYLVYGRDAIWKDAPPAPVFVMDQIGLEEGQRLNGAKLGDELNRLISERR